LAERAYVSPERGPAIANESIQSGNEMKIAIIFGALGVIAMTIWLSVDALEQSGNISLPTTLTAVKDLVDR
jgi:hypothetical protein